MCKEFLKQYRTINKNAEIELTINKSRFIGRVYPISTEVEALELIAGLRKRHYDATHNCYAYSVREGAARYSDDGEPGGTAGLPIMNVLQSNSLTDILCVVTRYFGGILLGAGGLVRAYTKSAAEAVALAGQVDVVPGTVIRLEIPYDRYGGIEFFIRDNSQVLSIDFAEHISVDVVVNDSNAQGFMKAITEKTNSRVSSETMGAQYIRIPVVK